MSLFKLNRRDVCEQSRCAAFDHGTGTIDARGNFISNIQSRSRQQSDFWFAERNSDWRKRIAEAMLLTFLMLAGAA
ncbi:hypothetical protein [Paraburkholderia sediminicola]|uniref:hypothetical protein n=1 Tax=Paraburkholderia sediminicola TaxID=458836 RepID=UPI0038BAC24C